MRGRLCCCQCCAYGCRFGRVSRKGLFHFQLVAYVELVVAEVVEVLQLLDGHAVGFCNLIEAVTFSDCVGFGFVVIRLPGVCVVFIFIFTGRLQFCFLRIEAVSDINTSGRLRLGCIGLDVGGLVFG